MASPDAVSIVRQLGIRESGESGSLALFGPGDHAAPHPSCRAKARNHEANRLAYLSSHLFDAAIYGSGVEDHAGIAAPLNNSRDTRYVLASRHNQYKQSARVSGRDSVPRKTARSVSIA